MNNARWINFGSANDLKTKIVPSIVKFISFHKKKKFLEFQQSDLRNFALVRFLLSEKEKPKIFTRLSIKSIHSIPQSAILTPFFTPIPSISNFA